MEGDLLKDKKKASVFQFQTVISTETLGFNFNISRPLHQLRSKSVIKKYFVLFT